MLLFYPVTIIPLILRTHLHFNIILIRRTSGQSLGTFRRNGHLWKNGIQKVLSYYFSLQQVRSSNSCTLCNHSQGQHVSTCLSGSASGTSAGSNNISWRLTPLFPFTRPVITARRCNHITMLLIRWLRSNREKCLFWRSFVYCPSGRYSFMNTR